MGVLDPLARTFVGSVPAPVPVPESLTLARANVCERSKSALDALAARSAAVKSARPDAAVADGLYAAYYAAMDAMDEAEKKLEAEEAAYRKGAKT